MFSVQTYDQRIIVVRVHSLESVDEANALLDAERALAAGVDWDGLVFDLKALDAGV